jgi:hypothetical protein
VDKKKAKKADLPGTAKLALDQLRKLIAKKGKIPPASEHIPPDTKVCSAVEWRESFCHAYAGESDKPDTKRKAFVRATLKLQEVQLIGIWSDKAWLVGSSRTSGHDRTSEQMSGTMSGERLEPDKTDAGTSDMGLPGQDRTSPLKGMSGMSDVRAAGLSGSFDQNLRSPEFLKSRQPDNQPEPLPEPLMSWEADDLRARGFSLDELFNMKPKYAREILADPTRNRLTERYGKGGNAPPETICRKCGKSGARYFGDPDPTAGMRADRTAGMYPLHLHCCPAFFASADLTLEGDE